MSDCPKCEKLVRELGRMAYSDIDSCPPTWRKVFARGTGAACPESYAENVYLDTHPDDDMPAHQGIAVCIQCWRDWVNGKRRKRY